MEKYINDAIIGNSNIIVGLNKKGDILRFYAPEIDYMQHINEHKVGLVVNINCVQWFNDTNIFKHEQYYEENANIVYTKIYNDNICIMQRDFVDINIDVLVRTYSVEYNNYGTEDLKIIVLSSKERDIDRFVCNKYDKDLDCLMQFTKDTYFVTFSNTKVDKYIVNDACNRASNLWFDDREYEGLSNDGAVSYCFEDENNNSKLSITLFIGVRENYILTKKMIETVRKIDTNLMYEDTKKYWHNVINKANMYNFKNDKEKEIYIRSILTLPMYTNNSTGGTIAALEVDERLEKCGRYAYCWPRDAMYFMNAYNACGLKEIANIFYTKFVPCTQSENGMWEQRFYTDTSFGPSWGEQTDQTSSMIVGLIEQYSYVEDEKLKAIMRNAIEKGIQYLLSVINAEGIPNDTYDIWETFYGNNQYTLASMICALKKYQQFDKESEHKNTIIKLIPKLEHNITSLFWREDLGYFVKTTKDSIVDSSFLGTIYPFNLFSPTDEKVVKTVQAIENRLTSNVGGIKRFENDQYMDGNPWVICTLWLSLYYISKYEITNDENDKTRALEYFDWVTNHSSLHGFLPEQVCKNTAIPIWVNGLAWSHGLYIICIDKLYGKN